MFRDSSTTVSWAGEIRTVVFLQVSTMLSGKARESRDNISELSIGLSKGIMGWGNTNLLQHFNMPPKIQGGSLV